VRTADLRFSAFILVIAIAYEAMAFWMPRGSLKFPGPGYYPMLVGIFLIATSLGCVIQAIATRRPAGVPTSTPADLRGRGGAKAAALLVLLAAYGLFLPLIGFPIAIFTFLLVAIRIFGFRKWPIVALIAIGLTAISFLTFVTWLKVPLPLGVVGDLLD
jgi:hypothetical protein